METRYYILTKIDGDYAHLTDKTTGDEILVARALLPYEADEGDSIVYSNLSYSIED